MTIKRLWLWAALTIIATGCTSTALRHNTANQSKTLSDLLADQVLYNLALYKDFYDNKRVNGIPSFVKINTGMASVMQSINGSAAIKLTSTDEEDPTLQLAHATTDNWSFSPVTSPDEINRLFCLYEVEFNSVAIEDLPPILAAIYPPTSNLDSTGKPILDYKWVTDDEGFVIQTNNQLLFKARPHRPVKYTGSLEEIPGALHNVTDITNTVVTTDATGKQVFTREEQHFTVPLHIPYNGWFSFSPPTDIPPKEALQMRMGPYLNHYIWITNRINFVKFAELALGSTNLAQPGGYSLPLFINQNGVILPYR